MDSGRIHAINRAVEEKDDNPTLKVSRSNSGGGSRDAVGRGGGSGGSDGGGSGGGGGGDDDEEDDYEASVSMVTDASSLGDSPGGGSMRVAPTP